MSFFVLNILGQFRKILSENQHDAEEKHFCCNLYTSQSRYLSTALNKWIMLADYAESERGKSTKSMFAQH